MIIADLEPRAFLGPDAVSYSELSTLARCEAAWAYGYTGERERTAPSKAMALGTEVHLLWGKWWTGSDWQRTENETAAWLMQRFAEQYVPTSMFLEAKAIEMPLAAEISRDKWFFGFADALIKDIHTGELWIGELKTTAQLSNVTHLLQSLQMPLYVWAARKMGYPVVGAMLDVIRTFKPVKKELPLAESFDRRFVRFDDAQIVAALDEVRSGLRRRADLRVYGEQPMRNIGQSCSWCFAMSTCYGLDVEVLPEADDAF